ncbi:hypothetical protein MCOR02_005491 [Pyricularia oryzae]|uniref:Secondary metabolism biosynthetic enzyme n=2 Tax=Pyricularia TaxID=48558 RepID=A0ABQ8N2Q6_PYRGI|nr:hypothetical protein MCOR02_005491 [Pyricularia oryzae]KAI6290238.1 putative secondary metabolism biosynthetic enzyme [Pyricularia grisea]KAI6325602.1 putative secondary metabolism biosynthetic enzyme [Pyricularia oryzae]KAI6456006.1 putative secondary metabolism biosynthetic enzyme [Pyricularia oryzae]KAI6590806.1 putative secondary metabolism biosynthetic enzyme [Pyricularia oryzae]
MASPSDGMNGVTNQGKVIYITGGSSGIGLHLAEHLLSKGWCVAISARQAQRGEEAARALDPTGNNVLFVKCDVTSYEQQAAAFLAVWQRWGRLDAFVANAGVTDSESRYNLVGRAEAKVEDVPREPDTACLDTGLKAVVHGTVLAVHYMRHNSPAPGGEILVTGSVFSVYPGPVFPEYAAAKAGSANWVRSMAPVLLGKDNITINEVCPGPYNTNIMPDFDKAFLPEHHATKEALLYSYLMFLEDSKHEQTGNVVEVAHDKLIFHPPAPFLGGPASERIGQNHEPWFVGVHGEASGLPGAVLRNHTDEEVAASWKKVADNKAREGDIPPEARIFRQRWHEAIPASTVSIDV